MQWIQRFIATGAFSGYSPTAPGTVGTILFLLAFLLIPGLHGPVLWAVIVVLFVLGVWSATGVEAIHGHDAQQINIDEMVGMAIALIMFPAGLAWYWTLLPFLLFRLFDVLKPFPINRLQNLSKGWGVMMDDVLAGVYAWIVFQFLYSMFIRGFVT
ncbi:phosphatidylglycerophosphatase A [bacterium]|nr:phosphatidylglycerophosphatase A [bacterium]